VLVAAGGVGVSAIGSVVEVEDAWKEAVASSRKKAAA